MSSANSPRLPHLDALKGIAILLMIQVHLLQLFATPTVYNSLIGKVGLFLGGPLVAPLFLATMGYCVARTRRSSLSLLARAVKLLLLGLALNVGLNAHLLWRIHRGEIQLDPMSFVFGIDILICAGLSIAIIAILRKLGRFGLMLLGLLVIGVIVFAESATGGLPPADSGIARYFWAPFVGGYSWSYFPLVPWLSYSLFGFAGHKVARLWRWPRPSVRVQAVLCFAGFAVLACTAKSVVADILDPPSFYLHSPELAAWTLLYLAVIWRTAALCIPAAGLGYVTWLGRHVTSAYVIQWLLIGNIATAIYKSQTLAETLVWYLLILGLTSAVIALTDRALGRRVRDG
ncbi:MAG: putative membrane protein [Rhodothermales bacterium]|jgi:uncharacterized membrane protein